MANSFQSAHFLMSSRFPETVYDADSLFDLGVAYSTGSGVEVDLVAAHKWFNLAAVSGSVEAQGMRAEVAEEMSAREIVEAQKQARAWLAIHRPQRQAA